MTRDQFKKKCEAISEFSYFFEAEGKSADAHEDDGTLHVTRNGIRACFDVSNGQNCSGAEQNENVRSVASALGIKVTDRMLVEEDEEEECCGECGRPY